MNKKQTTEALYDMQWAISVVSYKVDGMKGQETFFGGFLLVKIDDDGGDFSFS